MSELVLNKFDLSEKELSALNCSVTYGDCRITIINDANGNKIDISEDIYPVKSVDGKVICDEYVEYTVCFSTQHCHFEDADDVKDYVMSIINDEILPIEFYGKDGNRRIGGEIGKDGLENPPLSFFEKFGGYDESCLARFDYEIYSWSGKYDRKVKRSDK